MKNVKFESLDTWKKINRLGMNKIKGGNGTGGDGNSGGEGSGSEPGSNPPPLAS